MERIRPGNAAAAWGDISTFSFYANKLITTGEGGMMLTSDPGYAERARSLRNLCFRPERRFYHTELGYNYRLTNLQAALGLAQLERFDEIVAKKRWMGQTYTERLKDIPFLQLPVEEPWAKNVYWMYGVVLDGAAGMHEQPVFLQRGLFQGEHYPVAERLARQGLYLPSGIALTESQLDQVCTAVRTVLDAAR